MARRGDRAWLRWLAVPWREWSLAGALVGAAAAPVMLVASADVWRAASEDDIAERSVSDLSLERNGLDVLLESRFAPDPIAAADAAVDNAFGKIAEVGSETRTLYTFPGLLTIGPPPLRQVGPAGRLFARDGALDAVDVVEQLEDTSDGVWVTTWFAERWELELGDGLGFEAGAIVDEEWNDHVQGGGANSIFRIVGTYEPLWSPDPDHVLDDYWAAVPPELVPVHLAAFNGPNAELVLADETTVLASDLTGATRWRAPLTTLPETYDELRILRNRVRGLEADLVATGELGSSMAALATVAGGRPRLQTDLFDTVAGVESAARRLLNPLAAARGVGGIVGIVAMVAVGVFFVERRRSEFRLLASEGERWPTMSARVAGQLALPAVLGGGVGVLAALAGPRWFGPAVRFELEALPLRVILLVSAVSLAIAAVTAGVVGGRSLLASDRDTARAVGRVLVGGLVIGTVGAWVQVGRTAAIDADSLDLVVVALPVLVVLLTVVVVLIAVTRLLRRSGRRTERLPIEAFLAVRRLADGSVGGRMVAGALGLGVGLVVFAIALTSTLDRTVSVKLATEIGGESAATLIDDRPADPRSGAPTTVFRTLDTQLTPGGTRARIIAIDLATFADAVTWPEEFGAGLDDVLDALAGPIDEAIPAVAIEGEGAPSSGAFGLVRTSPFRVVDRIPAFTGAGESRVSLLVSAEAVDRFALMQEGYASAEEAAAANFRLPIDRFRRRVISQGPADELAASLDEAGVRFRDLESRSERREEPGLVATRSAFGYLGVIGVVAGAASLVALAMSLAARRRANALTGVMTRSMGLSPGRSALVSAIEMVTVLLVAVGAGFVAAPLVVSRLAGRFDPSPDRPPEVSVLVPWGQLLLATSVGVSIVAVAIWWSERWAARRPAGEVVRDAG